MTGTEIVEKYDKALIVVKQWMLAEMMKYMKEDSISDDFKDKIPQLGVETPVIIKIIDENPRSLFDFFDGNKIYINICPNMDRNNTNLLSYFSYSINSITNQNDFQD